MEEVKRKYFNALQVVELDATQHPEQVFDQMKARMEARGYSIYAPLCEALKLIPPERGVADMTDQDLFKFYLNAGLREGEPEREVSIFKGIAQSHGLLTISYVKARVNFALFIR